MVEGWKERPKCTVSELCDKPGVALIGTRFACSEHLMKYYDKQREIENKLMEEIQ